MGQVSINGSQLFRVTNVTLLSREWCIYIFFSTNSKGHLFSLGVRLKFVLLHFGQEEYETLLLSLTFISFCK